MKTNNEMISEVISEINIANTKKRKTGKTLSTIIMALSLILCIGIGAFAAKNYYPIGTEDWLAQVKQNAVNATGKEAAEEFRERMRGLITSKGYLKPFLIFESARAME